MTCCRKGCGIVVVAVPVILMIMALIRQDWSVSETHMIVQDKQARVAEDSVLLEMGPFKTRQEVFIGESAAVSESSYNWCSGSAGLFTENEQSFFCVLLWTVRVSSFVGIGLGVVLFAIYLRLMTWSAKLTRFSTTAKVAGGLHLLQTIAATVSAGVWWYLAYTYMTALVHHLPVFQPVVLAMGTGWYYAVAGAAASLLCTIVLFTVSRRGVQARVKAEEIQRKIREFKAKQVADERKIESAL